MKKVKVGVVGMGGMGSGHCKSISKVKEIELTCVCDVVAEAVEEKAKEFGVEAFTDYKKLIDSGLCQAVIVATPHWFHPDITVYAFKKGLHVLSEKPIAVTVSDADRIVEAAKKSGKIFSVMYQRRLDPKMRKALEIIKSGMIGEIQRTLCVDPWYRTQAYYDSAAWRATWLGEGGGVLINQAPHTIDLFTLLGGLPVKVEAKTRTKLHKMEVEDEAAAVLEYSNGAWGYYYTTTCEAVGPTRMEFAGDKGKIAITGEDLKLFLYSVPLSEYTFGAQEMWGKMDVKEEPLKFDSAFKSSHAAVLKNFARAILFGEEVLTPGVEGINSVEFINAVIMSGKKKKPVKIPVDRGEYDSLMDKLKKTSKKKKGVKTQRVTDPGHVKK